MVSKNCLLHLRRLANGTLHSSWRADSNCITHQTRRTLATITEMPVITSPGSDAAPVVSAKGSAEDHVLATIYSFPNMEPLRFAYYPHNHLYIPMRKDILHRAIIYEGDSTRQGTASTKYRTEIHGSRHKLRPQKGTGRARLGDRGSPMLRGGGVAFGPHPRDFSTELPKKIYDFAWRMALSHRYRRGELVVVNNLAWTASDEVWWLKQVLERNGWGNGAGGSVFVAKGVNKSNEKFFSAIDKAGYEGKARTLQDVDVKNLLEHGRVVIEQKALKEMIKQHSSDLQPFIKPLVPEDERPGRITTSLD